MKAVIRPVGTTCPAQNVSSATGVSAVLAAAGQACSECASKCEPQAQDCKDGSVKSCYLATVCLCQCNLDAGGCGSSKDALQTCVDDNQKLADELK